MYLGNIIYIYIYILRRRCHNGKDTMVIKDLGVFTIPASYIYNYNYNLGEKFKNA
jgi:hypothetical protein